MILAAIRAGWSDVDAARVVQKYEAMPPGSHGTDLFATEAKAVAWAQETLGREWAAARLACAHDEC